MHQFIKKVNTSSIRHTNTEPYQLLYGRYAVWWIVKLPRNNNSENIYSSCFYIFCKPGIPLASLCSLRAFHYSQWTSSSDFFSCLQVKAILLSEIFSVYLMHFSNCHPSFGISCTIYLYATKACCNLMVNSTRTANLNQMQRILSIAYRFINLHAKCVYRDSSSSNVCSQSSKWMICG